MNRMKLFKMVVAIGILFLVIFPWGSAGAQETKGNAWEEIWLGPAADAFVDSGDHPAWFRGKKKPVNQLNFGCEKQLAVRRGISGGFLGEHLGWQGTLIRFDLASIPPNAEILEADLYLYHFGIWQEQISIHRLEKNWVELEASWEKPCESCAPWSEGWKNGNYRQGPTAKIRVGKKGWYSWDVKGDVREYLAGLPNYGWFLKSASNGNDPTPTHFFSREMNQGDLKPRLKVRLRNAVSPLAIQITAPANGMVFHESPVMVTGTVSDPAATVKVNGLLPSITGNTFQASIPLSEGANTIVASAEDQYGQKASDQVSLTLITRGNVEGMVTDALDSVALPSASVSVTDGLSVTQTALTGQDGRYQVIGVAAGAFSGSISREGYHSFNFSGTMVPGQTVMVDAALNPIVPGISNISVANITADSAQITWVTDMPADSRVDCGLTTSYGNTQADPVLTTSHQIILSHLTPETTYHFKVTSKNVYGFSSSSGDQTFTTQALTNPITLNITSPQNGDTISRSDARVEGTIENALGIETGVVVNGVLANVWGNQFVANHLPLVEGPNTITVQARDARGNAQAAEVEVNAAASDSYLKLSANVETGIAPLEFVISMDSNLDLTQASLTCEGSADVELVSKEDRDYRFRIPQPGVYHFKGRVQGQDGSVYEDWLSVTVLSREELDVFLQGKWESMRAKLGSGDVEGALVFYNERKRDQYRNLFNALAEALPQMAQEMADIQLVEVYGEAAIYDIRTERNGTVYSFQLLITKDTDGIWRIAAF